MDYLSWVFVYTPLPWLAAMYTVAYRHDLGRVAKPFDDRSGLAAWWAVCRYLGLISPDAPRPARRPWRSRPLLAVLAFAGVAASLPFTHVTSGWYYLVILQAAFALSLFLELVSRIGPLPAGPYRDMLAYPRLGTRVRHLMKRRRRER
ncbi:MAG: hypothetical protein LYZ69_01360 [Nitrososphaerales archaeon]|nr:hypothetical protein [Nitrososphaerales archaeon]